MLTFQVLTLEVIPMILSDFQMAAWPRGLHIVTGLVICQILSCHQIQISVGFAMTYLVLVPNIVYFIFVR